MRATVSLRPETPSLRYTEMAWVLTVLRETNNRSLISAQCEMGRQEREQPELGGGERRDAEHVAPRDVELGSELVGLGGQIAEAGAVILEVLELTERGARPAGVGQRQAGVGQL